MNSARLGMRHGNINGVRYHDEERFELQVPGYDLSTTSGNTNPNYRAWDIQNQSLQSHRRRVDVMQLVTSSGPELRHNGMNHPPIK